MATGSTRVQRIVSLLEELGSWRRTRSPRSSRSDKSFTAQERCEASSGPPCQKVCQLTGMTIEGPIRKARARLDPRILASTRRGARRSWVRRRVICLLRCWRNHERARLIRSQNAICGADCGRPRI
jgi:hypothetical protein